MKGTVLIVDDEPQVLKTAATALRMGGYRVLTAATSREAELICRDAAELLDVLVMDVVLQGEHGFDVAPSLLSLQAKMRVIYISGYPGQLLYEIQQRADPFLFKPFTPEQLIEAVDRLVAEQVPRAA